jgi:hypothetical protein
MKGMVKVQFAPIITTAVALLIAGCAGPSSFEQATAEIAGPSTTYEAFTRAEPKLRALHSGDALTRQSLGLDVAELSRRRTNESRFVVYGDGWIPSMSGRGALDLGRPFGLEGNTIYGRHIFGYVYGNLTLVPKYELLTKATVVPDTEFQELKRQGRDQGVLDVSFGKEEKVHFFKDVTVDRIRPLPFQGPPEMAKEALTFERTDPSKLKEHLFAVYTKTSFEDAEAQLKRMQAGTDWWDMVHQLNGHFMTHDFGESYVLYMKGYANYKADQRWQIATRSGVYEVWPFGYVEGDKEVLQLSVIFRNGKLQRIVPYEPEITLAPRLREPR